ncbi:MAG: phosphotransferase [Phycisphaerae bacterium]|nr:phosphotransferase [Phycisphaerae bacterium]MDD5381345.1 phosphotransferase [Phycisphaerae bacterium]
MPRGGANFSSEELAQVLSHYDVGVIHRAKPLPAGSRRAPKLVVTSERGKFLLKRRPKGKDDLYHVAFAHAIQSRLSEMEFPLAPLVATCDEKNTILHLNNHIYELFEFITGFRYDGSAEATADTGRQLANFHRDLADFAQEWKPPGSSFHDSSIVRTHLKTAGTEKAAGRDKQLNRTAETLMAIYNESSVHVSELGFDSWPEQIVHGDWHPGNMLFSKHQMIALLDFDSVKIASPVTDLANGMLQFSIVGNRPNPVDWPDYLDQAKLVQFLNGYREVIALDENRLNSLLDLMIETMIAEAILPVAATGYFGNFSGLDFLKMIQRKAEWLDNNRDTLTQAISL